MKRSMKFFALVLSVVAVWAITGCKGCSNTSWKTETGNPSYSNRIAWKKYLKTTNLDPSQPIPATMTQISNVSHKMAVAKINQAMQAYSEELGYSLSTVFELAKTDEYEQTSKSSSKMIDGGQPAVEAMVVDGHLYYVGFLDYRSDSKGAIYAAYEQTKGIIPAVAIADGEDALKPAWIRTRDAKGNPYQIRLRLSTMTTYDDNNIFRHLRNNGFSTLASCDTLNNPTLEMDDDWRPFWTVIYDTSDACAFTNGKMSHPLKLVVVDAQTTDPKGITSYDLPDPSDPNPKPNANIPKWIDQIYSPETIKEWINAWGYNPENYGKSSEMDEYVMDGDHLDEVMDAENKNIMFEAYITSRNDDDALIGVMFINPQTGTAQFMRTQGIHAMATKTSAINAIRQAVNARRGGKGAIEVEDLTLHTIYGVPTWQGELTLPAVDNDGKEYGSLYYGMAMLQANYDHQPEHVQWGFEKRDVFTKYERWLILSHTQRIGSNVDEKKEIVGTVAQDLQQVVVEGNTDFLVTINEHPGVFAVPIQYLGDPNSEEVFNVRKGDRIYMKYADPVNTHTFLVLEIHGQSRVPVAETKANEHVANPAGK